MMNCVFKILLPSFLALLIIPILLARIVEPEARTLEGVRLDETDHREIVFRNSGQGLQLAGLLFIPDGKGPFPAAIVIHGSGSSDRGNGWYLALAQYLQRNGILVLLPDKRGSGKSEGRWQTASYLDLATDAVAAIRFLQSQDEISIGRLGVVGLSQGGRIAPIVATEMADLAFVISIVGGAVPAHEALVYEETHNLRELGILPGLSDVLAYPAAWSLIYVRQRDHWNVVGNFDPVPYWQEVAAPSLVLYGEGDTNVNSKTSAARLRALGKPNIEVRMYEGSGHALEDPPGQGNNIFRRDALDDIKDFIQDAAG
jgi:dienelactone hydrolase